MADNKIESRLMSEIGVTGLDEYSGYVKEQWVTDLLTNEKRIKIWDEISRLDPTGSAMMMVSTMFMREAEWDILPASDDDADVEQAQFVKENLTTMTKSFSETMSDIVYFLAYGFFDVELVYERRDDGRIYWRKWAPRHPTTLLHWDLDENGGLQGMVQISNSSRKMGPPYIPIEKMLHFTTTGAGKNSPEGRALDPNTPIVTPDGWRKIDDLRPGNKVFDEKGRIRYVIGRKDWENRPCYKVTFDTGVEIIADESHKWYTENARERAYHKRGRVRTTKQIAKTVKKPHGKKNGKQYYINNHAIPWAESLDYPHMELVVEPYLLGQWLGDGHSNGGIVTSHVQDVPETVAIFESYGYDTRVSRNGLRGGKGRMIRIYKVSWKLNAIGVLNNKHIPRRYLMSSRKQRLELLQGLMDSDGTVDRWGRCEFTNTNRNLAYGAAELIRSLGGDARITTKERDGCQITYKVKFTPHNFVPFKLSRKIERCKDVRARTNHYITKVERVPPRRTVCIQTDGPSHLFLAGEGMIPTHNSIFEGAYTSWFFAKNLKIEEAIVIERMSGTPVMGMPDGATTDSDSTSDLSRAKKIVRNIKLGDDMGLTEPFGWSFRYEMPKGSPPISPGETITRHQRDMARTIMADFLMLGGGDQGSWAMHADKSALFIKAVNGFLQQVASVINRHGIPRLMKLNGHEGAMPEIHFVPIAKLDVEGYANIVARLLDAGGITYDLETEQATRRRIGLPEIQEPGLLLKANQPVESDKEPIEPPKEEEFGDAKFYRYTYNGVTCRATRRRSSSRDDKAWMRTVKYKDKERLVHYADPDMPMRRTNKEARKNFLSRHSCSTKKDPFAAGFWSCYDWANPSEDSEEVNFADVPYEFPLTYDQAIELVDKLGQALMADYDQSIQFLLEQLKQGLLEDNAELVEEMLMMLSERMRMRLREAAFLVWTLTTGREPDRQALDKISRNLNRAYMYIEEKLVPDIRRKIGVAMNENTQAPLDVLKDVVGASLRSLKYRVSMYSGEIYKLYQNDAIPATLPNDVVQEKLVTQGDGRVCDECEGDAEMGWVPVGVLKPIGERICLSACRCNKVRKRSNGRILRGPYTG
jgi:hypothetical protein